jgi:chemotaxis signal transduction protein
MKGPVEGLNRRLEELRRAFDDSFALPALPQEVDQEDMLGIRVGSLQFAVRVNDLAGVHACRKIVALPESVEGLLGVVGLRGRLVAVYDLAELLGAEVLAAATPRRALTVAPPPPPPTTTTMPAPPASTAVTGPGAAGAMAEGRPRWMLLCREDSQVGLAIEALDAYMRVSASVVHAVQGEAAFGEHVREVLFNKGITRGVLSMSSLLAGIARRASATPQLKET